MFTCSDKINLYRHIKLVKILPGRLLWATHYSTLFILFSWPQPYEGCSYFKFTRLLSSERMEPGWSSLELWLLTEYFSFYQTPGVRSQGLKWEYWSLDSLWAFRESIDSQCRYQFIYLFVETTNLLLKQCNKILSTTWWNYKGHAYSNQSNRLKLVTASEW